MNKSVKPVLKQRLVTAAVLAPVAIAAVLLLPTWLFAIFIGGVALLGAHEWLHFYRLEESARYRHLMLAAAGLVALFALAHSSVMVVLLLLVAGGGWCINAGRLADRQQQARTDPLGASESPDVDEFRHDQTHANELRHVLSGAAVLGFAFLALVALHVNPNLGSTYVLYLLSLIWMADSTAFFAGRKWGKRHLAPAISPGKTWEGVLAALAACAVWAVAGAAWLDLRGGTIFYFFVLSLVTVVFSIVGDLYESLEKRSAHVKDSGSLLPGHGGVLDRIDSITAAAPIFTLGAWWMG